jgi:hypothetical protein
MTWPVGEPMTWPDGQCGRLRPTPPPWQEHLQRLSGTIGLVVLGGSGASASSVGPPSGFITS